jgi:hypothetical protein
MIRSTQRLRHESVDYNYIGRLLNVSSYISDRGTNCSRVELVHNLKPLSLEVTNLDVRKYKEQHGNHCDFCVGQCGQLFAKMKKGARIDSSN